jgi:hypothetical protein
LLLDLWLTAFGKHQRHAVKRLDAISQEKSTWPRASKEAIAKPGSPRKQRSG